RDTCAFHPSAGVCGASRSVHARGCSGLSLAITSWSGRSSITAPRASDQLCRADDKRLFLLDAYALIYRAYFSFIRSPRINSQRMHTSAAFGFSLTSLDLIKREKPTHIAVVFDTAAPTERHVVHTEYKANRQEMPDDIR